MSPSQQLPETPSMVVAVRATVLAMAVLTLLVCIGRLYVRKCVLNALGIDDYLVMIALVLVLGFAALSVIITFYGIGYHQDSIPEHLFPTMQLIVYVSLCTYLFVGTAVKSSLTAFIMRVFPQRHIRLVGYGIIAFLILFTISGELPLILQCRPVRAAYDKTVENAYCLSSEALFGITMYQGVLMFLVDITIIALPMPSIWRLQMPLRRKIVIAGLFSLGVLALHIRYPHCWAGLLTTLLIGILVCIAALIRLPTLVYQNDATDYTYSAATSLIWMNVEFNIGLIVGSLPSLRKLPLLKNIFASRNGQEGGEDPSDDLGSYEQRAQQTYGLYKLAWKNTIGRRNNDTLGSDSCERIVEDTKFSHN